MKRLLLVAFSLILLVVLNACGFSDSEKNEDTHIVNDAIEELFQTQNYSSEWYQYDEGKVKNELATISKVFHFPYKAKSEFDVSTSDEAKIVAINRYQKEENSDIFGRVIYYFNDGSVKYQDDHKVPGYEWFIVQIRESILSEKYIREEVINERETDIYEITIDPYPIITFYRFEYDKSNEYTKIFLEEYEECIGYAYIDKETGCLSGLEFAITDKKKPTRIINRRIHNELDSEWFIMPYYKEIFFTMSFYDFNDESAKCAAIEKEIDEMMELKLE